MRDACMTHSCACACALLHTCASAYVKVVDFGLLTTPQLHWIVHEFNHGRTATLEAYYKTVSQAFYTLVQKEDG